MRWVTQVGPNIDLDELYSSFQAKLAVTNLIEIMGLVEMLLSNAEGPDDQIYELHRGWAERMDTVRAWCATQTKEMVIFGEAFDTDKKIGGDTPDD